MSDTKFQTHQLVNQAALPILRQAGRTQFDVLSPLIDGEFALPLRLYAANPSSAVLNIAANRIISADGAAKTTSPIEDLTADFANTTINFQTGALSPSGNVLVEGATFALPASVSGQFKRCVFSFRSDGKVDTKFSGDFASYASLPDPGSLFAGIDGTPIGWIDLVGTATSGPGAFKTASSAGSSATSIIENAVSGQPSIFRFAAGGGGSGAAGDRSFKLQAVSSPTATIKGGYLILDDGRELATYNGSLYGVDISINLTTIFGSAPADATTYYVYIDQAKLGTEQTQSTTGRKLYQITQSELSIQTLTPNQIDLSRYVPIGYVRSATTGTAWSGAGAAVGNLATRRHQQSSVNVSPLVYEDTDHSVGTVGSAGQLATYGDLVAGDFSDSTKVHWYKLNSNATDGSPNTAIALTANGTPAFTGVGFFGRENVYNSPGGTVGHSSTDSFFRPAASKSWAVGCWAYHPRVTGNNDYIATVDNAGNTDRLFSINYAGSGNLDFRATNTAGSWDATISVPVAQVPLAKWFHIVMVYDFSTTTLKAYIDGQKFGTASLANTRASAGSFFLGVGSALTQSHEGMIQDFFFVNDLLLSDSDVNKIYSKRFKGQQLAGGHVLGTDSFPLTSLVGKATFYNLSANANDGSANAKNLTNNGSIPFTGLGLFGAANAAVLNGSSQYLSVSDAFFAENTAKIPMGLFAWIALDDYTPGSTGRVFTWSSGQTLYFDGTSIILDGAVTLSVPVAGLGLVDGQWIHVGVTYAKGVNTIWVNGIPVGSNTADYGTTSNNLFIGSTNTPSQYLKGRISNVCFMKSFDISEMDIRKLISARIDLASSVSVRKQDQNWKGSFISEDGQIVAEMSDAFLVDKDDTKVWVYFGGGSASRVNLRLYDGGLGASTIPVRKFDRSYTGTPSSTIAHGLPSMPTHIVVLHNQNADGKYVEVGNDLQVKADGTNIYADLSSLTIDATHDVRIVASIGVPAIASTDNTLVTSFKDAKVLSQVVPGQLTAVNGAPGAGQFRSEIVGRKPMVDLVNDIMPRMGVERIMIQSTAMVDGEIGPTGGIVQKPINDKYDQIRFSGNWVSQTGTQGSRIAAGSANDFFEVVFVGTGLNLLISGSGHNVVVSIDGGADSANLASAITVQPLAGRNYAQNLVLNLASGLSYGLHTVRVKTTTGAMDVNGIEILNESSSVKTSPGLAIVNGLKRTLASVDSQTYNTGFDSGTLGTRGGRVVMYMRADGTIGKSVQPVAAASAFLTSTSHTDEEVVRSYNWKEFGSGRADDFSVIAGGAAANYTFTLDDGTTTLAGNQVRSNVTSNGALRPESSGSFVSLTFVGTGLDISAWLSASSSDTYQVIVDGTNVGNLNSSFAGTINRTIASGLPYGTHTVKINRVGAASNNLEINSFTVYGPKKPSLPFGAMELADYNIMATYVANATAGVDTIGTGVLRKSSTREHVYSGASWSFTSLNTSLIALLHTQSITSGGYVEYTFFGTGFEWRSRGYTTFQTALSLQLQASGGSLSTVSTTNYTISHNGGGASGSGPAITTTTFGGIAFTPASGNLSQAVSTTDGSGFTLTGLALGLYKVRITQGSTTIFEHGTFDVITPIHSHKYNGPFIVQNTLSIGSQGVNDSRKFGDLLPTVPNTSVQAFGLASSSTTSTAYVPVVDLSATIKTTGNPIQISYALEGYCNTLNHGISLQIYIDGVAAGTEKFIAQAVASTNVLFSDSIMVAVSPGVHKVDLHWKVSSGTGTLSTGRRNLTVREI